ncbi:SEFIR domain-containing protein [Catellatospora citrea]|uniref:effector-associated domain 2-containing protein n=1 Tax=Catellatospora citrea TaxID=53366 RepID=UPI00340E5C73
MVKVIDSGAPVRVVVSYAWDKDHRDHRENVRALVELLRASGIDARMDLHEQDRPLDWPLWFEGELRTADFVVVAASATYKKRAEGLASPDEGRGVQFEAGLLRDLVIADRRKWSEKILTVLLPGTSIEDIPLFLNPQSWIWKPVKSLTPHGVEDIVRILTGQPRYRRPPLGPVPRLPAAPPAAHHTNDPAPGAGSGRSWSLKNLGIIVDTMDSTDELSDTPTLRKVINLLPPEIRRAVPFSEVPRSCILHLVRTCARYPGGRTALEEVLDVVMTDRASFKRIVESFDRYWPEPS